MRASDLVTTNLLRLGDLLLDRDFDLDPDLDLDFDIDRDLQTVFQYTRKRVYSGGPMWIKQTLVSF